MAAAVSPLPETLSSNKKRVIQELIHGQEYASQLQVLFHKSSEGSCGSVSAEGLQLVEKIVRSFDETISVLSSCDSAEFSQTQAASNGDSPCSEDSSESRRKPAFKDKRGCYKRKRGEKTWTVVSAKTEDGHQWRKYGQKDILNCKYPRSYFRCTRKHEQGCKATKHVQKMENDPQLYQTIYIGNHTCRESLMAPQLITESESWESYIVTSGDDSRITSKHQHHPSNTTAAVKQESKEETALSDLTELDMWKDIIGDGDVVSNVYPCNEITGHLGFEPDFNYFDENDFLA